MKVLRKIIIGYDKLYKQYDILLRMEGLMYYIGSSKTKKEISQLVLKRLRTKKWIDVR